MSEVPEISSLETNLRDAVKEVLGTTFSASPEFTEPEKSSKGVSAIIGISDGISGFLAVHVAPENACKIAGAMLGDTYTEVDDIVCDALGELANMFGGSLKKFASTHGEPFKISVPTIVRGKDYETHAAKDAKQVLLGLNSAPANFTMQLVVYSHA
ncbi:MAG: chemotaxis protein CheX [Acidobacteriota bacterium]|jgi:chemotaxis protein CheX|nr:chemotaxis protein CheX [Acidobacteriota bacterium]